MWATFVNVDSVACVHHILLQSYATWDYPGAFDFVRNTMTHMHNKNFFK